MVYPPDREKKATDTVLEQAGIIAREIAQLAYESL
jgi:hypothetical protein